DQLRERSWCARRLRAAAGRRVPAVRDRRGDRRLHRRRAAPPGTGRAQSRRVTMARMLASVLATAIGLAFWWGLTEPVAVPAIVLLGVSVRILLCAGVIAG